jgi:non-specific serine/threonine protein kinase
MASTRADYGRAAGLLEQSLDLWKSTGMTRGRQSALLELGRVAFVEGHTERAGKLIGESLALSRDGRRMRQIALCVHALACVAVAIRQPTRAAQLFGAAAALGERVSIPLPEAPSTVYARAKASAEDQLGAEMFTRAWDTGYALPLEQALSLADDVVASAAVDGNAARYASPKPAPAMPLTPRQADVLRLVAEGKTDRQIAAELILSEKTVGRHLENIFARLGVSSRAAASVVAFRQGFA